MMKGQGKGREAKRQVARGFCSGSGREKTILHWIWKGKSILQWIWKGKNHFAVDLEGRKHLAVDLEGKKRFAQQTSLCGFFWGGGRDWPVAHGTS